MTAVSHEVAFPLRGETYSDEQLERAVGRTQPIPSLDAHVLVTGAELVGDTLVLRFRIVEG